MLYDIAGFLLAFDFLYSFSESPHDLLQGRAYIWAFRLLVFFVGLLHFSISIWNLGQTMINRIFHRSPMQSEKSQPAGKRILPDTRFTEFPALSVDPRVGISLSALETDV